MKCDTSRLTFVFGPSAGLYSTMASVLAGSAFLAITLSLVNAPALSEPTYNRCRTRAFSRDGRRPPHHSHDRFHVLILTSIQYAEIAAETGCAITDGRSASEQFLAGVSFVFSVLLPSTPQCR